MGSSNIITRGCHKICAGASILHRNAYGTTGDRVKKKRVNLEWVDNNNLGDELAPVIYHWMLDREKIAADQPVKRTTHLMTVGSMLGAWKFDAVVWGSGVHIILNIRQLLQLRYIQKFDIRAVRGPLTRKVLLACGHECPEVYGDPAVLMPFIYMPENAGKKQGTAVVYHYRTNGKSKKELEEPESGDYRYLNSDVRHPDSDIYYLNIGTGNYKKYIDEMMKYDKIISASLHGIILAEAYGIPAVFLNTGGYVDDALMKYYDWYYSTGRYSIRMARSLEEAIQMEPMPLPDLKEMQQKMMQAFPYDLWSS